MGGTVAATASERRNLSSESSDGSSDISEAKRLVHIAAEPFQVGDTIKQQISRAAKRLHWDASRTRDIWYGGARRIEVSEMDALRAIEQQRDQAADRIEQRRHLQQLAALRAKLQFDDPDFHAADIEAISFVIEAAK